MRGFLLQALASSRDEVCNILLHVQPIEVFSGQTNNISPCSSLYTSGHKDFGKTIWECGPDLHLSVPSFSGNNLFHSYDNSFVALLTCDRSSLVGFTDFLM